MKAFSELTKDEIITWINKDFKIKINGYNFIGDSISKVVGFSGLVDILKFGSTQSDAERIALDACVKALECPEEKFIRKLPRGLKITFYIK